MAATASEVSIPQERVSFMFQIEADSYKLIASDGAASDKFGYSVAISGDTAVVGAYWDDDNGNDSGSAYVFVRDGTSWSQQAKLTASDGASVDTFGYSVAISGDTAIVGSHQDDDDGDRSGSAYVFVRDGTSWSQQAKLIAGDAAALDNLGWSVAISGDTAVVGAHGGDDDGEASGSAYIFVREGTSWSQQAKLIAGDAAALDIFGWSVAISGDTAVVGALRDDDNGTDSGSAYVFVRDGTSWSQQAKLTASDGAARDAFGVSVAISGNTAIIGASRDDDNGDMSGSAYIFVREGTSWSQQAKLTASDGAAGDIFGYSVAISGNTLIIGAYWDDDDGDMSGSVYVFVRDGTGWSQRTKLTASDGAAGDYFGLCVDISADTAIVGAPADDDNGEGSGSAYVFELTTDQLSTSVYLPILMRSYSGPPDIRIVYIDYNPPGDDVQGEYVRIDNVDGAFADMTGWMLSDIANHVFTFPSFTLAPGATVRVWTKAGTDTTTDLYWGRGSAVWNNTGDCAYLRDGDGGLVSEYCY
jgi:hypothetical protein